MNEINWLSILIASCIPFTISTILYHKKVFGSVGDAPLPLGITGKRQPVKIIGTLMLSFLIAFFFLNFNNDGINQEGDFDNFAHGAWHGLFMAITTIIPIVVITSIQARLSTKTILVSVLFWLICSLLMGGTMDAMNHWENIVLPE